MLKFLYVLCVVTFCISPGCSSDAPSDKSKKLLLGGKYNINMKVRTANISGNLEDTGMSEVSNVKMWMEFFDNGKILNTTLAEGQKTEISGNWQIKGDSLFFETDRGLKYTYEVIKNDDGKVLLKNKDYELSLNSEE